MYQLIEWNQRNRLLEIVIQKHLYSIYEINCYYRQMEDKLCGMNLVAQPFEDLECLNNINIQYSERLYNNTMWGYS